MNITICFCLIPAEKGVSSYKAKKHDKVSSLKMIQTDANRQQFDLNMPQLGGEICTMHLSKSQSTLGFVPSLRKTEGQTNASGLWVFFPTIV